MHLFIVFLPERIPKAFFEKFTGTGSGFYCLSGIPLGHFQKVHFGFLIRVKVLFPGLKRAGAEGEGMKVVIITSPSSLIVPVSVPFIPRKVNSRPFKEVGDMPGTGHPSPKYGFKWQSLALGLVTIHP